MTKQIVRKLRYQITDELFPILGPAWFGAAVRLKMAYQGRRKHNPSAIEVREVRSSCLFRADATATIDAKLKANP